MVEMAKAKEDGQQGRRRVWMVAEPVEARASRWRNFLLCSGEKGFGTSGREWRMGVAEEERETCARSRQRQRPCSARGRS